MTDWVRSTLRDMTRQMGKDLYYENEKRRSNMETGTISIKGSPFQSGSFEVPLSNGKDYPQEIEIERFDSGGVVTVGCRKVAFSDFKELLKAVELYYSDPEKAEKKYIR